jgi:hypothetical protein
MGRSKRMGSALFYVTNFMYSSSPVSAGNAFQDLPRLRETADYTERYICDIRVTYINTLKFN